MLIRRIFTLGLLLYLCADSADRHAIAQLRVVTYNTATADTFGDIFSPRAGADVVLEAIGNESVLGIAKPIDVLLLQEQFSMETSTQDFVDLLNDIYDPIDRTMYARSLLNGTASSDSAPGNAQGSGGRPGLVYNTQTVELIDEIRFGTANASNQARQTLRYQLRPIGYGESADFYAYNSHYKADDGSADQARRLIEATAIRSNADALPEGTHLIYAGDYNIQRSNEDSYVHLLSSGNGQAFDPIDEPGVGSSGRWHNESDVRHTHTQSPTASSGGGLAAGGVDDRFDFQLVSGEFLDGEGLSYIDGTYRAFGNNGTHQCCNSSITTGSGAASNVLSALTTASDHLPVVADYQLPAVLSAQMASIPPTVPMGSSFNVDLLVENIADVIVASGADELDYSYSVTGDLIGSGTGTDFALGGPSSHPIFLDASVAGLRSGMVTVTTSSQGAANPLVEIPVTFVVGQVNQVPFQVRDDFDSPVGLNSFTQSPLPGAFSSEDDGFERYQVGVSAAIPVSLVDSSTSGSPTDSLGIVNEATKTDGWFGITDLVNTDNPSGMGTATWEFDIAGASSLEVSIDMAAMGDFEASDVFDWTYSIDGSQPLPLFTSSVDEDGSATYTLADGDDVMLADPLIMSDLSSGQTQLSNVFQTLTSSVPGMGEALTIELTAATDGGSEAFAFDNIVINGITILTAENADFDQDGDIDGQDFLAWQRGLGNGSTLGEGDANGDGEVDELDLAVWQSQYAAPPASTLQAATIVPEPACMTLAGLLCASLAWRRPGGSPPVYESLERG